LFRNAAAAGHHDDIDIRVGVQFAQRRDDLGNRARTLDGGVADGEAHRGPPRGGHRRHVALCGTGSTGDQPDRGRQERQRPLEPRVEKPFGVQQPPQPLDAGQQLTDAYRPYVAEPQR
jgi:hypothetical protein